MFLNCAIIFEPLTKSSDKTSSSVCARFHLRGQRSGTKIQTSSYCGGSYQNETDEEEQHGRIILSPVSSVKTKNISEEQWIYQIYVTILYVTSP